MSRATKCMFEDREINVHDAIDLRDDPNRKAVLNFLCIECSKPVRPHKDGSTTSAHFEHHRRNPNCKLSDPAK